MEARLTASVQYWRLPDEEADLVSYLVSLGPTMAIPVTRVAKKKDLVWKPVGKALAGAATRFLITPQTLVGEMKVHENEDGFAPSVTTTPALYYSRGQLLDGNRLSSTALSAEWAGKPEEFVRWGKKVMQWVRRTVPGWYKYKHHRITTKADAARVAGMEMVF